MNTCQDSFKKKTSIITNQAFLSNNIITSIEKKIERDINTNKTICKKLKLSADHFPKINNPSSQNISDPDMKFTFNPNDNADKNFKKDVNKKRFKV